MTEAPGDQTAMPAHQRIGGDERGDGVERPSPEEPSLRRQSTTLIVSQPKLPATKLLFEDPVPRPTHHSVPAGGRPGPDGIGYPQGFEQGFKDHITASCPP